MIGEANLAGATLDFRLLFESIPGAYLVLTPDSPRFTIVAVSNAYLRATKTQREEILGRGIFEVFPDNPDDPSATGVQNLRRSLQTVLQNQNTDVMAFQKYDIPRPESEGGGFEERYWSPVNSPVLGADNEVAYIIHRVEDVTEFVQLQQQQNEQHQENQALRVRTLAMEAELYSRVQALKEVNSDRVRVQDERNQAEAALREAHVLLESALVAGAVYTWRWKIPDDRVMVNAAFAHLFAVDPVSASTEGLPVEFFINSMHEEDRPRVSTAIQQAIDTGEGYATEYRVRTASGEERWLTARGRVEYDAAGNPVSFPGALVDITERKFAEEALRQSEERYRTLFESIDDGFCIIEMLFDENDRPIDYRFLEINPAFEKQSGLIQAMGKRMLELAPTHEKHWVEIYGKIAMTGEPLGFENHAEALNRWFDVYACRIGPSESRNVAVLFKDITDRKRIEAEREQILQQEQAAREAAERANRIKDEFLAVLSHELRSPLNPILGWSRLLQDRKLDEKRTAYALETIERNAKLQVQLIDDLLDVARILRGKLSLNVAPVNLAATITAALETVRLAAEAKSIQIQTMLEPDVGRILGDSGRLQQVIWNLMSNAIKFTPQGGRVNLRLEQFCTHAQITVSDTGKGIHPDFLPYMFESFRQADSATTRQFGGLGLGLAIVRQIVELHGGTVQAVSSGVDQGATFTVKLPLMPHQSAISQQARESKPATGLQDIRVLVVEDTTDMREYITFVLEQEGAKVVAVASAAEALTVLAQFQPQVLVSDIGMPEVDGYMLMRQVRMRSPQQGGQTPAIALTAYVGEINQQQALAAGFQRHIAKPVAPDELVKMILSLL